MLISDLKPYVRYARYMELDSSSVFATVIPLDARLFYVKSGKGTIVADGGEYEMSEGALLIVNPGVSYRLLSPEFYVKYVVLNFDYSYLSSHISIPVAPVRPERYDKAMLVSSETFSDCEELKKIFYLSNAHFIEKKLSNILKEYSLKFLFHDIKASSLLCECICDSLRAKRSASSPEEKKSVDEIIAYIHENFSKPLTNGMIGEEFSYHPNYISSVIKLSTGMPLHKYLLHVRLLRAVEMLENSSYSVGEIASLCGFCDIGYFSAYFKKHFGTGPSHYRKKG
ncbi:MAG: helix-turn-helix transcriptional regulator [Clostridia bacterium]|nr:helix-turn-helix transcriptional regulator [Clostridia bacterium]